MADITPLLDRTLVLVAHPDDETVGCGALLQRMAHPVVAFATDGAPEDEFFWKAHGSRLRYARVREEEARRALGMIGVSEIEFVGSAPDERGQGITDQCLHAHLADACERLADVVRRHRPQAILTLAYEGGHPDHDSCSLLAARLGSRHALPVWEFPLYHRQSNGEMSFQRFVVPSQSEEAVLEIAPEELVTKQAMLEAYASQQPFLAEFDPKVERFRPQHLYDYSHPPHTGRLNYEAWRWPMTGADVCAAFDRFAESFPAVEK